MVHLHGRTKTRVFLKLIFEYRRVRKSPYCEISELHGPVRMLLNGTNSRVYGAALDVFENASA